jgi:cobalt-zinc-cadmium efflux system protein
VLALVAVRWTLRRPTTARSFGYHRGTVLAAQANGAAILAVTLLVGIESVRRLADPGTVRGGLVLVVALVAAAVNGIAVLVLHEHGGHDVNMRAVMLHAVGDALASLAVAAAGAVIFVTGGNEWLDPAASLVVCAVITVQGWRLLRETTDVLLESTPSNVDVDALTDAIAAVSGVESVHDLHVWSLSSDVRALSAHLVLAGHPTLEEAQVVGERVKATIGPTYSIAHATLELECEACADVGPWCAMDGDTSDTVPAGRTAGA